MSEQVARPAVASGAEPPAWPTGEYLTVVADPPWEQPRIGRWKLAKHQVADALPYHTMSLADIAALPVAAISAPGAHLWLWTTNAFLDAAFDVMRAWGYTYLTTVTWVKPSGCGAYFAGTTQHCLFGYYKRCRFEGRRWAPTHFEAVPPRHSEKPERFYALVEEVSAAPRLEMFARKRRDGWDAWGDEVPDAVQLRMGAANV